MVIKSYGQGKYLSFVTNLERDLNLLDQHRSQTTEEDTRPVFETVGEKGMFSLSIGSSKPGRRNRTDTRIAVVEDTESFQLVFFQ